MKEFVGRHAVITGGSSGIGLATARLLAERGAVVSLVARRQELLDTAAAQLRAGGADVRTRAADVADQAALTAALHELVDAAGPCDLLITSAGLARPGHFLELSDEVFRQMIEVDYFGTLYAVRALAPDMVARRGGSIVAVSSGAALAGIFGYTAYGPAKFAVRGLMEALRAELKPHGVHVACVYPPDVDTPQLADENRFKPAETAAISGTVKPMRADAVAAAIVAAVERERFAVYPNAEMALLAGVVPLFAAVFRQFVDRRVRRAREAGGMRVNDPGH
jgi:3-dehydrosphinganine reductase